MRNGKRQLRADHRPDEHYGKSHEIDGKLEHHEFLYVLVKRTPPHHGGLNAGERVVKERYVARLFRHRSARPHRQPDIREIQGGRVVCAVARNRHHLPLFLEQLHQALLVERPRPAHHFQAPRAERGLLVGKGGELRAAYRAAVRVVRRPEAYAPRYFNRRPRGVARHYLHLYPGAAAAFNGGGHFVAHGVADGGDAHESEAAFAGERLGIAASAVRRLAGESQGAHGLRLVLPEKRGELRGLRAVHAAHPRDYLRRAFHEERPSAERPAVGERGHVFPLCRERELAYRPRSGAQRGVVLAFLVHPQKQGALCGVPHAPQPVPPFEAGCGIHGYRFAKQALVAAADEVGHLHPVLRKRARLVGADYGDSPHCLAGVHFAHEVVCAEHPAHVEREAQRHGHGQAFGHGHHDERHGRHEIRGEQAEHFEPVDFAPVIQPHKLVHRKHEERQHRHAERDAADEARQAPELSAEGRVFGYERRRLPLHLAYFGSVAHGGDPHHAAPFHHHRGAQGRVGGVGARLPVGAGRLRHGRLPRKARFVYLQRDGLEQLAVGGDFVALPEYHDVAHDDIAPGYFGNAARARHLDRRFASYGVQLLEAPRRVVLEVEGYARSEEHRAEDAHRLGVFALRDGYGERQAGGEEEYAYERVSELAEVEPERRGAAGRGEHVAPVRAARFGRFRFGEARRHPESHVVVCHLEMYAACAAYGLQI